MKTSNAGLIKHYSYNIEELTKKLNIDERTIRRWIKDGLQVVPGAKKPILILGGDITAFLTKRKKKHRIRLKIDEFFCVSCKKARRACEGTIEIIGNRKKAVCEECKSKMCRAINLAANDYMV